MRNRHINIRTHKSTINSTVPHRLTNMRHRLNNQHHNISRTNLPFSRNIITNRRNSKHLNRAPNASQSRRRPVILTRGMNKTTLSQLALHTTQHEQTSQQHKYIHTTNRRNRTRHSNDSSPLPIASEQRQKILSSNRHNNANITRNNTGSRPRQIFRSRRTVPTSRSSRD